MTALYLRNLYPSVSPPVRQLNRFKGVTLEPRESETVEFTLTEQDLSFHNRDNQFVAEAGEFKVMIGGLEATFELAAPAE